VVASGGKFSAGKHYQSRAFGIYTEEVFKAEVQEKNTMTEVYVSHAVVPFYTLEAS